VDSIDFVAALDLAVELVGIRTAAPGNSSLFVALQAEAS
jgi:hypothetical protein